MHEGYGSCLVCLSVRPSICLSVPTLAALAYACTCNQRYSLNLQLQGELPDCPDGQHACSVVARQPSGHSPVDQRSASATVICAAATTGWEQNQHPLPRSIGTLQYAHGRGGQKRPAAAVLPCTSEEPQILQVYTYSGSCSRCVWRTHTSCTNTTLVPQDNL